MDDDFDVNDLDDLVDRHRGDENDGLPPQQRDREDGGDGDGDGDDENDQKRIVPVKIRVKKPQPKLNAERLRGPRGLSVLPAWFENTQFKGKGHESKDLNAVINRLEQWTHRLFPRYTFDDTIDKLEKLGKKNEIKVLLKRIRMDLDNDFVTQMEDDIDDVIKPLPAAQDDIFDKIANTIDIFPVTSTPSVGHSVLTEEQRQRMMQNRMLAEERRQAKIRARQEQILQNADPQ